MTRQRQLVFVYFVFLVVVNLLDYSVRQSLTYLLTNSRSEFMPAVKPAW
jgi:hypothetical protein